MGQRFFGGSFGERQGGSRSFIRAMDIRSGSTAWEYPLQGGGFGGSGTLATAGGLVFWGMAVSFMSIDWILSVKPEWFSTMFPLLVIVGQALTAMAFQPV